MELLIDPNIAYLLIVVSVISLLRTIIVPRSILSKIGMFFGLGAELFELSYLRATPWALVIVALSPLPFFLAIRQTRVRLLLVVLTILLLVFGSYFLILDQTGRPVVNCQLAGLVSMFCGEFIWIAVEHEVNAKVTKYGMNPKSVVGLIGEAHTEVHQTGTVRLEGDIWIARSDKLITAGSMVRVIRCNGAVLTVKKAEKLTTRQKYQ